jgi:hypothetical protein
VILRIIRGRADRDRLGKLRTTLDARFGGATDNHGPIRIHVGARGDADPVEALILVFWTSFDDIAAADARGLSPLAAARDLGLDLEPAHFEVDETIQRRSDEEPIAIRLATGRFSKPGADIEMQDLLRQRVPQVGDDMTEAYVGRRLVDRMVDVSFVSAWRRLPPDRPLDSTFWMDIALRYDSFTVEVFTPVRAADVE